VGDGAAERLEGRHGRIGVQESIAELRNGSLIFGDLLGRLAKRPAHHSRVG